MQGSSLKTLKQVKMYSIPVSDPRVSELITWYLGTLQRAIDIIWENVEWRHRFPRIKRKKQVLIAPSKFKAVHPRVVVYGVSGSFGTTLGFLTARCRATHRGSATGLGTRHPPYSYWLSRSL